MPQLYAFINNGAKEKEKWAEKSFPLFAAAAETKSETLISLHNLISLFHLDLIVLNGVK